jgi:hypothetical protein
MKSFKNPLFLLLVWMGSLLALCLSFFFYSKEPVTFQKLVGGTFLMMIYSVIFSFPAFIFFLVVSIFTLRSTKLTVIQKKIIMNGANLFDILLTFGALYLLISDNAINHDSTRHLANLKDVFAFYPLWALIGVSTLLILILPFNFKKTLQS